MTNASVQGRERFLKKQGGNPREKQLGDSIYLRPNDQHVLVPAKISFKKLSSESLKL